MVNPFKKLIAAKRKAEGALQGFGHKLAGRSFVNNETNPDWVINKRKKNEQIDAGHRKFMDFVKKRGKVR